MQKPEAPIHGRQGRVIVDEYAFLTDPAERLVDDVDRCPACLREVCGVWDDGLAGMLPCGVPSHG